MNQRLLVSPKEANSLPVRRIYQSGNAIPTRKIINSSRIMMESQGISRAGTMAQERPRTMNPSRAAIRVSWVGFQCRSLFRGLLDIIFSCPSLYLNAARFLQTMQAKSTIMAMTLIWTGTFLFMIFLMTSDFCDRFLLLWLA